MNQALYAHMNNKRKMKKKKKNHRPSQHLGSNLWLLWADELLVLSHLASFFVFNGTVHHHLY
jgi:hypothetical protein